MGNIFDPPPNWSTEYELVIHPITAAYKCTCFHTWKKFHSTTRVEHILTPSTFLGHPIPFSSHIVSSVASLSPISSGMLLLSSNQVNNLLVVTQSAQPIPTTIQVGTTIPLAREKNPPMGKPLLWGKQKYWGKPT
jgi:hypothetical protein